MDIHFADVVTIGMLVLLEGVLSADNALVMAVMVLGLPEDRRKKALSYGLIGAFAFRIVATLLAVYLIKLLWVKVAGGAYLLWLVYQHFFRKFDDQDRNTIPDAKPGFGLSAFWATVLRVELVNLAFSIDSILVAVGISPKIGIVLTGGILGIIAMRLVVGQIMSLIEKYPALVDGAFIIIAWVAIKLFVEYMHQMHWIGWSISQPVSLIVIAVIFTASYLYARKQGPRPTTKRDIPLH
jgi:YkoY family integral membrane protein